ncbi:MAG: hypothetical protein IKV53_02620 [Clostridia bacterium]|nr:hypothetical protein [Clostridia bacterium]
MRTIIINTTKEANDTGLDFLFKAPFDSKSLLWIDTALEGIKDSAEFIRETVFTQASLVDRDYKLIVLVNLCSFPRGDEEVAASIYKALLTKYISHELIERLAALSLVPESISLCYLEPEFKKTSSEGYGERNEDGRLESVEKRTLISLFGWDDTMTRDGIRWRLETSFDGSFIDMRDTFAVYDEQVKNSRADSKLTATDLIIDFVNSAVGNRENWGGCRDIKLDAFANGQSLDAKFISFKLRTDNEQEYIEGFFSVFASVFKCVEEASTLCGIEALEHDSIEWLLKRARAKYKHYSEEENIELETEDVRLIVEGREELKKRFVDNAERLYGLKDINGKDTSDKIRNKVASILGIKGDGKDKSIGIDFTSFKTAFDSKNHKGNATALIEDYRYKIDNDRESGDREGLQDKHLRKQRISSSLDKGFRTLVEAIYENYDADRIKAQNKKLIDNCYRSFWDSRDKQSRETLIEYINELKSHGDLTASTEEQVKRELNGVKNGDLHFYSADMKDDYNKLVEEITDVEHKICKNRDVLLETRSLALRYDDIKRRGRLGTLAVVGGFIAIATAILPYILIQGQSINSNIVHLVLYILFTAGFAALYLIASIIFLNGIIKKKRMLLNEASDLFAQSVWDRWESAVAFYTFYAKTTVEAEAHKLIWAEVEARVEKNRRYCAERNNHKIRLGHMIGLVDRFITRLKYSTDDGAGEYSFEGCDKLKGHEAYYTEHNRRIYSILDKDFCTDCCKTDNNGEEDE